MRYRFCKKVLVGACAMVTFLGQAQVEAQGPYDQTNAGYYAAAADNGQSHSAELERRLRILEASMGDKDTAENGIKEIAIQTKPSHKFRGRLFFDHIMMDDLAGSGGIDSQDNFTGFDTIRLGVTGNIFENLKYTAEFEFEGMEVDYKDVYGQFTHLPWVGNLKVGHFKEPFGLEQMTSSRFVTFMERSVSTVNYTPARNMGISMYDYVLDNENLSWYAGVFRGGSHDNATGRGGSGGGLGDSNDTSVTGRVAWLPYYDEATPGRCLLHLGMGATTRRVGTDPDQGGNGQLEGYLELDSRDGPIDFSLPVGTEFNVLNGEVAWMRGPLSLQGEAFYLDTNSSLGVNTWGGYAQVSYFLTGENRGYNRSSKSFARVMPYENFFAVRTADGICRGWGAWEVAARYSHSDLSDLALTTFSGSTITTSDIGDQDNFAAGVNWYLNPYSRVMMNYVHTITDTVGDGKFEGDHVAVRFQIDW